MTNKLREAALEALKELQQLRPQNQSPFWFRITEDLRAALAQPAASGEPVAWRLPGTDSIITAEMKAYRGVLAETWAVPLYATAQPTPALVPLTDEQAMEIAVTATPPGSMASRHQIVKAIRLAERHHGIFPSKENPL